MGKVRNDSTLSMSSLDGRAGGICGWNNRFRPSHLNLNPGPHPHGQGRVDPAEAARETELFGKNRPTM